MDDRVTNRDVQEARDHQNRVLYNLLLEIHERTPPHIARSWVSDWDAEASRRGLDPTPDYPKIGLRWIEDEHNLRRP
jgi:hypothetical protein